MALLTYPSPSRGDVEAVLLACSDGSLAIVDAETGEVLKMIDSESRDETFVAAEVGHGYIATCTVAGRAQFTKISSLWSDKQVTYTNQLPGPISIMRLHPEEAGTIAFGGQENGVQVWGHKSKGTDEEDDTAFMEMKPLWAARNVKNDKLELRVPVWITDLSFCSTAAENTYKIVTSTQHKQLRVYDSARAKRPISNLELSPYPIARLLLDGQAKSIFADSTGNVMHVDMTKGTIIGSYKGFAGAVSSIAHSKDGETLVAGGMDTYLRGYAVTTHEEIFSVYVASRISQVLMLNDDVEIKSEAIVDGDDDDEEEDVWAGLEETDDHQSKKARHG